MTDDSGGLDKTRVMPKVQIDEKAGKVANPSNFENFIGRVITSVQHRKKNPRLKSLFGGHSSQNTHPSIDYSERPKDLVPQ